MKPYFLFCFFCIMCLNITVLFSQTIDLTITNIKSTNGEIVLGIYKDQKSFDKEEAAVVKYFPKGSNVNGNTLRVKFNLDPGVWGVTLLDDENSDHKMNYNWIGWPKEGFGFSNNYHTGLTKPGFNSFKFTLAQGSTLSVSIKVRYM